MLYFKYIDAQYIEMNCLIKFTVKVIFFHLILMKFKKKMGRFINFLFKLSKIHKFNIILSSNGCSTAA